MLGSAETINRPTRSGHRRLRRLRQPDRHHHHHRHQRRAGDHLGGAVRTLAEAAETAAQDPSSMPARASAHGTLNFTDVDFGDTSHAATVDRRRDRRHAGTPDPAGRLADAFGNVVTDTGGRGRRQPSTGLRRLRGAVRLPQRRREHRPDLHGHGRPTRRRPPTARPSPSPSPAPTTRR